MKQDGGTGQCRAVFQLDPDVKVFREIAVIFGGVLDGCQVKV